MNIGIDGNEANVTQRVGSGQYSFELLRVLYEIDQKDNYWIFLKNVPVVDMPRERSNWHYRVFGPKIFWTQLALPTVLFFQKGKIDVFFSPSHYAPRFSHIPQVVTIFDLSFLHFPQYFKRRDLLQLTRWTKYSVYNANAILTISESSKNDIIKAYNISKDKIFVTYPGYNGKIFKPQGEGRTTLVKKKYKIGDSYIIYIGTLQPRKNIPALVRVFKRLSKKEKNLQLVIVGKKGWLYQSIFEEVRNLKMQQKVIFTDFLPEEDMPPLLSGAKVYVLPSLYEGFGIPVVEAMACGTPVAVSDVSSLPEVVGDAGLLFDPRDENGMAAQIERVIKDDDLARRLSKKGLERAQKFSWRKAAEQTLKVLERVSGD